MTPLETWARRYGVPPVAVTDLLRILGAGEPTDAGLALVGQSEAAVQQATRLTHRATGGRLWRNNSGMAAGEGGRPVRFGLGNDSAQVCAVMKSSDLIGITPVTCQCGCRYGVFTAYEVKRPGWRLTPGDKRAQAQLTFIKLVTSLGGIGRFVTSPEEI